MSGSISTSHTWQPLGHVASATVLGRVEHDAPLGLLRRQLEEADRAIGAGDAEHAVAILDVADGAASSSSAASSCAFFTVRSDATCTAEPPTKSEREPALPKPVPRSVSPNAMRMRSIGTPNTSTASCANVVASDVPIGCVAEKISIVAVAAHGDGHALLEHFGARPFEERREAAPAQPAAPLRVRLRARRSRPSRRSASPWSSTRSNWPVS